MTSKSKLNLYCQKRHTAVPCYSTDRVSEGFESTVTVDETSYKSQKAHSTKRAAEDDAASVAIQLIVQSHPEVENIDQLIDNQTTSKKHRSHQQLHLPATQVPPPPLGNASRLVEPSGQLPPPGLTAGVVPNHSQPHFSGFSPAPQMPPLHTQPPTPASLLNPPIQLMHVPIQQYQSYWDDDMRHKGRPASAIPANPHHSHSIMSSSPTEQNMLSNPQNSSFSVLSPPLRPPAPPQRDISKQQEALEALCRQRGLSPPSYHIAQNTRGYYTAKVILGGSELSTLREYDDFDTAKESATALAVIELGLQALTLSNAGDRLQAPVQEQVHLFQSPQQQIIRPPSLTSTLDHPQQTPLATTSIHTTGSAPLHPPSFFHTPSGLTGHSPQLTPSQALDRPLSCLSSPPRSRAEDPQPTLVSLPQPLPSQVVSTQSKGGAVQANMTLPPGDYKQMLNIYCQKKHIPLPSYSCEFPEDSVGYIACVKVAGMTFSSPPQGSKKLAEAIAAAEAVKAIGIVQGDDEQQQSSGAGTGGGSVPLAHQPAVPVSLSASGGAVSFKNVLQEYTQKSKLSLPHYETERTEEGFKSTVSVYKSSEETVTFTSAGYSVKKAAEQEAAKIACTELNLLAP